MLIENKYNLLRHNTMRLNSVAKEFYQPETISEFCELCNRLKDKYILSGGSNVLLPPEVETPVISMMNLNNELSMRNGEIYVGCSVRIQKLINFCKENEVGGIEYLYSVPSSVGGAVVMNAGRGRKYKKSISDFITKVQCFDGEKVIELLPAECQFSYRTSVFQKRDWIVLGATFKFPHQCSEETARKIQERLEYSKEFLSADKPSCGSVFNKVSPIGIRLLKGVRVGGAAYSKKTPNWISNVDNASYSDVLKLIRYGKIISRLFFVAAHLEIKIWK